MLPIIDIAAKLNLTQDQIVPYGADKAKIKLDAIGKEHRGRLVLVTAMSPSPAGEGKTTTSIGLVDGLNRIGRNASVALREPSMGPVFGMKGGGAGGGCVHCVQHSAFPPVIPSGHPASSPLTSVPVGSPGTAGEGVDGDLRRAVQADIDH